MVSLDDAEKNREFAASLGAGFPLLSDPQKNAAQAYGVVGPLRLFPRRWTFFIDPKGVVRAVDKDVNPESAGPDLVEKLEALGFPRRPEPAAEPGSDPTADPS